MILNKIRRRLGYKLFLSYLVVILVGVIVLATTAEFAVPTAFERHMAAMSEMMMPMMGSVDLGGDLFTNFRSAVKEALGWAALAATSVAILVSAFVSRQVVAPVQAMTSASQRIAEGHYEERVQISGNVAQDELDELEQLALSFNRMAEKLEQTENMRKQLIGDVSHELRTPLTAIQGSMEGLMDGVLPPTDETYQAVYREADRLKRLVDDLQELSRVEAGAYELNLRPVAPSTLVTTTRMRLEHQFEEKGVVLELDLDEGAPKIMADEDRIGQVLVNLVGNALQYTPPGGKVTVSTRGQVNGVRFAVADTGVGISAEHLPLLFTRFYRIDKSRSRAGGGSGIGLTIAKHLVEAHNGRIWAESPGPGKGSSFIFVLPVSTK